MGWIREGKSYRWAGDGWEEARFLCSFLMAFGTHVQPFLRRWLYVMEQGCEPSS